MNSLGITNTPIAIAQDENLTLEQQRLLTLITAKPIAFHRPFLYLGLNASEGLFLSQACYLSENRATIDCDGWFHKTMEEWKEEIGIGRKPQESARKKLRELGILEEKKQGIPAKLFFRVNHDVLHKLLLEVVKTNEY
ncbi:hypothetical protein WAX88_01260 [Photobacterium damselae subsp. damselae]|uniref:hypothetical protein n=1 Tax=Photobacterium damselae TaxID=38293 RepID=UPI00311B1CB2